MRPSTRPRTLTEDLAHAIYERLGAGQSITALCEHPAFPSRTNFYRWRRADLAFDQQVAAVMAQRPSVERRHPRRGRISYDPERAQRVIERLNAGESQKSISRDPDMPCVMTLLAWSRDYPAFGDARAVALRRPKPPRPRRYAASAPEKLEAVCRRLVHGEPLSRICADPNLPSEGTVRRHARLNPTFRRDLALAREMGADLMAHRALTLVEQATPETVVEVRRQVTAIKRRVGWR